MRKFVIILFFLVANHTVGQVELKANGPGNTYEEITAVLAPNYNPIEVPDCNHNSFGRHIDEIFDNALNAFVFRFFIHTDTDNDRCIKFDRQRNEIKSYDKSPDNLLGVQGETVEYKWKFKLNSDFQVSPNFTHIHQLKSVGGSLESMPMYTLTLRKANPNRLELRYAETDRQITLKQADLNLFLGEWIQVTETIRYDSSGSYQIKISKVSDGTEIFSYSNQSIVNWRPGGSFVRPKWGIYRSLLNKADLRDEEVLFADFSIEELNTLSTPKENHKRQIKLIPNPSKGFVNIEFSEGIPYSGFKILNSLGQEVHSQIGQTRIIDTTSFSPGVYAVVFLNKKEPISIQKLIVE